MRRTFVLVVGVAAASLLGLVPAVARSGGPATVTGSHSWMVQARTLDAPLSVPPGPDASPANLPTAACPTAAAPSASGAGSTAGEGIVSVTMSAPGTDWGDAADTSVVVDVQVDHGSAQQVVLFGGAAAFRYQGFLGAIAGGKHCVTVTVRPDLSQVATVTPTVQVFAVSLGIVPPDSPAYLLESHSPVLFGRSTSAVGDTPLVSYGQQSPDPDGVDTDLSFTVIWTHEDVGDGVVPAYEWGLWGRMTDIETVLHEKVAPDGHILAATYLSCGCENAPVDPDPLPEDPLQGGETDKPYPASGATPGIGNHLALRDATGNNDESPFGTTAYRFQQTLVAAPGPGQAREVAMDQNPWTYRISNGEVTRETVQSTDPGNFLAGQYPQYLIVDIDSQPSGTSSVAVAVQLDDGSWFSNDYQQMTDPAPPTTFPYYNGGHQRTVIKLPLNWHASAITHLQLRLNAQPGTTPSMATSPVMQLIEVTPSYSIVHRPVPAPEIVTSTQLVPPVLGH